VTTAAAKPPPTVLVEGELLEYTLHCKHMSLDCKLQPVSDLAELPDGSLLFRFGRSDEWSAGTAAGSIDAATQRQQWQLLREAASSGDLALNRRLWQVAVPAGLSKRQLRRTWRRERAENEKQGHKVAAAEAEDTAEAASEATSGAAPEPAPEAAGSKNQAAAEARRARRRRRAAARAAAAQNGALPAEAELALSGDESDVSDTDEPDAVRPQQQRRQRQEHRTEADTSSVAAQPGEERSQNGAYEAQLPEAGATASESAASNGWFRRLAAAFSLLTVARYDHWKVLCACSSFNTPATHRSHITQHHSIECQQHTTYHSASAGCCRWLGILPCCR